MGDDSAIGGLAVKASRTYKLRLSDAGIDLFLHCHCRVAHLARDFIPYGVTLSVALAILETLEACDVAAELDTQRCRHSIGDRVRFVGSSVALVETVRRIADKLVQSGEASAPPRSGVLYAAALGSLAAAEDRQIVEAVRQIEGARL